MKIQLSMISLKGINRHMKKQLLLLRLKLVDFNHTSQYITTINTISKVFNT